MVSSSLTKISCTIEENAIGGVQQSDQGKVVSLSLIPLMVSKINALSRINDATTFKTLLADGTYESFGNRIYLAGACKVGKSTLASLLIGDKIPLKWKSTDGLRIFFGRNGIDVKNKTMVPLKRGKGDRDVLSKVLRGRPDIKRYQSNQDVTLIYSRRSGGTEQQAVSGISVSRSSTFKQTSPENVPSYTTSVENVHTIKGTTTTFVKPKQIKKLSEVKFISIHKDIKKKLRKGKYRVHIAPSDLVDFGGQKSYDMTHQLFIQGKGTFTLIFDGRKQLQDPLQEYQQRDITTESILKHWVDSILTYCGEDDDDIIPVILFVATHRDKINKDQQLKKIQEFNDGLTKMFQNHERQQRIDYNDIFFINATDANDQEVIRLKEKYVDIAFKQKSWGKRMPMAWVPLDLQMNAMKENNISLISKKELEELNKANDDLALTKEQLELFLLEQHSSGKILYFEGHGLGKYIIVQPTALVDILRSFITDEMFWPKDSKLTRILKEMTKSGKIKKRDLFKLWSQKEFHQHMPSDDFKEFIAHVLVHLDLLVEPNTRENICDYYLVPCAVKDTPPKTAFGDQMVGNTKTICLSYKLLKSSIPSALSFKLIGAAMNIWPLKETENGICLYHKAAIFCIDKSNTLHILVQNNQVMVCLKNETSNNIISPDIASCVQDCLTLTLRTALEFYHTSFGNVVSKLTIADLFKVEAMHKCESEICYVSLTETKINPRWKCSLGKEHRTKFPLYWTYKGQQNCHEDCEGLHEQCLNLCPEDKHLARFARCLEIQELYDIVILLGLSRKDWNDFEYKHRGQGVEPLMMEIDILCHWKRKIAAKPSFKDLFEALKGIRPKHILCQVLREDRTVLDVKSEILQGPPDNDTLLDLSRQIGNCAIHLGVELGIDFCEIQETMYDYKKMSQQNYDILKKWKEAPHGHNKTIRYLMHVIRIVNPVGFKFLQEKYNIV